MLNVVAAIALIILVVLGVVAALSFRPDDEDELP